MRSDEAVVLRAVPVGAHTKAGDLEEATVGMCVREGVGERGEDVVAADPFDDERVIKGEDI